MNTLKASTFAAVLFATTIAAGGVALAATTHHARVDQHERYAAACTTLSGQWSSAITTREHNRHLGQAKRQERMAQRDCNSHKVAELKAGVTHYRSALRTLGVRPSA